ncbi:MAG TPA: TatD family hydrolase [Patescibacteria group bacterium]|nr:TatD family hydrolase [Patescibacteria group bacterium]
MIDAHCHLNFQAFESDTDEVIKRAFAKGVTKIINTGTQVSSSREAVKLADQYENLYAIVGIHPHHADKLEKNWLQDLEQLATHPKVLAIGEIGMDYYAYKSNGIVDKKLQQELFEQQIMLAFRAKLPLQIHNRQAGEDVIKILLNHKSHLLNPPGMFHCFAGSFEVLKQALNLGFYIGFDGNLTYKGLAPGETTALPDIAKKVPLERLICETDSPYLTPVPHRGQRNEPQYVILVAEELARIKRVSYYQIVEQTTKNVYTVFTKL